MAVIYNSPKIVTDGLVLCLDAANKLSYSGEGSTWRDISGNENHFTLNNSPVYNSEGYFELDGSNDYIVSDSPLDLSSASEVTVELALITTTNTLGMAFEHTSNWNSQSGSFGNLVNSNGFTSRDSEHHTNARNFNYKNFVFENNNTDIFVMDISWKTLDRVQQIAVNGQITEPSLNGSGGSGSSSFNFANDYFYIGSRAGGSLFCSCKLYYCKVYSRVLSPEEIKQNYNATKGRFQ